MIRELTAAALITALGGGCATYSSSLRTVAPCDDIKNIEIENGRLNINYLTKSEEERTASFPIGECESWTETRVKRCRGKVQCKAKDGSRADYYVKLLNMPPVIDRVQCGYNFRQRR